MRNCARSVSAHSLLPHLHVKKTPKYCKTGTARASPSWRCSSRSSLPLDALPVPPGQSSLGAMCSLGRAEGTEVLILLPSAGAWARGRICAPGAVYLVPLGQQFQWFMVLWCLSVPHIVRLRDADGASSLPNPSLPCPTKARCLPLTQNLQNPAENRRCNIPPKAASRDFSEDPSRVSLPGCKEPPALLPSGTGEPPGPAGLLRCPP